MKYVEKVRGLGSESWKLQPLLNFPALYRLDFEGGSLTVGGVRANGFSETDALFRQWRTHCSADSRSGAVEQVSILPVADAVEVTRNIMISSGFAAFTVDFKGKLAQLELEPVALPGKWQSVDLLAGGKWSHHRLEPGTSQVFSMPFTAAVFRNGAAAVFRNGAAAVELGCGDDLWRYCVPERFGGEPCRMTVECGAEGVTVRRGIIDFGGLDADAAPRRPWRFSWHLAWNTAFAAADVSDWRRFDPAGLGLACAADEHGGALAQRCPVAALSRRAMRRAVRTAVENTVFANLTITECHNASHLERRRSDGLLHSCITELFNFKLWAERRGVEQGVKFALRFADAKTVERLPSAAAIAAATPDGLGLLPFVTL